MDQIKVEKLLTEVGVQPEKLNERIGDDHLCEIALFLTEWKTVVPFLGLDENDVDIIEQEERKEKVRRLKALRKWKSKFAFEATYRKLVKVLLSLAMTDVAEKVCHLLKGYAPQSYQYPSQVPANPSYTREPLYSQPGHPPSGSQFLPQQAPLTKVFSAQPEIADFRRALVLKLECHTVKARQTGRELGSGTYGKVIELISGSKILAGKVFNIPSCIQPRTVISKLHKEVALLAKVHHPNIVHFEGVCFLENQIMPLLLMERLTSSLHDYLLKPTNRNIALVVKLSILRDVTRGLVCLHSCSPAIIHRDLTGNNVLLDSELRAKIADFGNAQIMDLNPEATPKLFTSLPGTLDYMPPEAEGSNAKYDPSLDVFSFGHLSLFTAIQSPVHPLLPSTYPDAEGLLHARSEVMRRKDYLERAEILLGMEHSLVVLIKQCLHNQPALRPRTADLETRLQDIPSTGANSWLAGSKTF